jgi:hypothetical protein
MMVSRSVIVLIVMSVFSTGAFAQPYSHGPRQIGEVVLDELLVGRNSLLVKVGSNGCTSKTSFRIDSKKEEGITPIAPHYILSVHRIRPDECKAIVDEGVLIFWELDNDLGIKGNFTFSVRNMVYSVSSGFHSDDDSLLSIIKKSFSIGGTPRSGTEQDGNPKGTRP